MRIALEVEPMLGAFNNTNSTCLWILGMHLEVADSWQLHGRAQILVRTVPANALVINSPRPSVDTELITKLYMKYM